MSNRLTGRVIVFLLLLATPVSAQQFTWTGMRNPCKQSAEDGLNEKQLGRKIGTFILLPNKEAWAHAIFNVHSRFPNSRPWATWGVGEVRDAQSLTDAQHEEYLDYMDELGVDIFLELAPEPRRRCPCADRRLARQAETPSLRERSRHRPGVLQARGR